MRKILGCIVAAAALLVAPAMASAQGYPSQTQLLSASNATPQPNGSVTYTAQGFGSGTTVSFQITGAAPAGAVQLGTALASASGSATLTSNAPTQLGAYTVQASSGAVSASTVITVLAASESAAAAAPAVAPVAPAPPAGGLPATGTDSFNWLLTATLLTLVGVGLVVVAYMRRRPRLATQ